MLQKAKNSNPNYAQQEKTNKEFSFKFFGLKIRWLWSLDALTDASEVVTTFMQDGDETDCSSTPLAFTEQLCFLWHRHNNQGSSRSPLMAIFPDPRPPPSENIPWHTWLPFRHLTLTPRSFMSHSKSELTPSPSESFCKINNSDDHPGFFFQLTNMLNQYPAF